MRGLYALAGMIATVVLGVTIIAQPQDTTPFVQTSPDTRTSDRVSIRNGTTVDWETRIYVASQTRITLPMGTYDDPLAARRIRFHGDIETWRGFQVCSVTSAGEQCVDAATIWSVR